jgi:hypothetical protein
MAYNVWLVDISFAMPLGGVKFGLYTDYIAETNLHLCYTVNSQKNLTNNTVIVYMCLSHITMFKTFVSLFQL